VKKDDKKTKLLLVLFGIIPAIWLGLIIAPFVQGGLPEIIVGFPKAMENPFSIKLCEDSPKTVLVFLCTYSLCIGMVFSSQKNYRRGAEYGSAKWGSAEKINKKYADKDPFANRILTLHIKIGLDGKKHRRNLNIVVIGGSGSGKTFFYAKPNLLQANTSFFVLDCKGELLRDTGALLEAMGYEIKILDLIHMEKSHCFNPFRYIKNDNDVQKMVTSLFKATTPKGSQSSEPFWDIAAMMLLSALIYLLFYEAPEEEQNFGMVMELLQSAEIHEDDDGFESPLDILFRRIEIEKPEHLAVKYYNMYKKSAGKTAKSILITLASRLEKFNIPSVASLTATDEFDLETIGEKKTAIFAIIPDHDTSFNFLVSLLYNSTFDTLITLADHKYKGELPLPVHFLMDEFANVSLPEGFEKLLATIRSRNISVSIIIQNISQLKSLYKDDWESILGNCDEFLYLGGNETSTHKLISESYLGKETIDTNTFGKSTGHGGNYSTNYQKSGRELLDASEVRMLNNNKCLLFIRGEPPIMDDKYDIFKHPNISYTPHGGGKAFEHGKTDLSIGSVQMIDIDPIWIPYRKFDETFDLVPDEEAYYFNEKGESENEEKQYS